MTTAGSVTAQEIASRPAIRRRALALAGSAAAVLPPPGDPVLFLGCGTSYYIGACCARQRTAAGLGRTRAAVPSELDAVDDDRPRHLSRSVLEQT